MRKALALLLLVLLAGCGGTAATTSSDSPASGASTAPTAGTNRPTEAPSVEPTQAPEPSPSPTDDGVSSFGQSVTYDDGLVVTVGGASEFTPTDTAFGSEGFDRFVKFEITIVNGTGKPFDPALFTTTLQSANSEATQIFDGEDLGSSPSTTLLPGREAKFTIGYGVTDPTDLVLEVSPDFEHNNAIYTNTGA